MRAKQQHHTTRTPIISMLWDKELVPGVGAMLLLLRVQIRASIIRLGENYFCPRVYVPVSILTRLKRKLLMWGERGQEYCTTVVVCVCVS